MAYVLTPRLGLQKPVPGSGELFSQSVLNDNWDRIDTAIAWANIPDKPASFPASWGSVSGKPATFPAADHDAARVVSGVLNIARIPTIPVNRGGTGATSASGARNNLGLGSMALRNLVGTGTGNPSNNLGSNGDLYITY